MAYVITFVSSRGGSGKSSLSSQLAPAIALANPDKNVLLLDCSIHGDSSCFLMGGVREPVNYVEGVRTRGAENIAALAKIQFAAQFLAAAKAYANQETLTSSSFWRGKSVARTPAFNWKVHTACPYEVNRDGHCPQNLYVSPGGRHNHEVDFEGVSVALLKVFSQMSNTIVIVDTDCELSERGASLAAIGASDAIVMLVSSSWTDYLRSLDDVANGMFNALNYLTNVVPGFKARIKTVLINDVQKRNGSNSGLLGVRNALPFTPPNPSTEAISDILTHLHQSCNNTRSNFGRFFDPAASLATIESFVKQFVTGLSTVPETLWQSSWKFGTPIIVNPQGEAHVCAAAQIKTIANKIISNS